MMKLNLNTLPILVSTFILASCTSNKIPLTKNDTVEKSLSPIDTFFIDFKPTLPNTKYHCFRAIKDGKSGWMNIEGDWIVPPEYDIAFKDGWSQGVTVCRKEGLYGVVNFKNEIVIPFKYRNQPIRCGNGLIQVIDSTEKKSYFSSKGVFIANFEHNDFLRFRNGIAVIRSNYSEYARYPEHETKGSTTIYKSDFIVINTKFDTLLHFSNVPFLLEFGSLNNNRRTFFLYPNLGTHADLGISNGQYGFLDGAGNVAIEPKFRARDVFIPLGGMRPYREPDCPFYSNLSKVRELDNYYFIDTLGNKVFEVQTEGLDVWDIGDFNNFGVAGYRTSQSPNISDIHLIDRTGKIIYESVENKGPMSYVAGNVSHQPFDDLIPIIDYVRGFHRVYYPDFTPFAAFPIRDSSKSESLGYRVQVGMKLDSQFVITQYKNGLYQRLIDKNGAAKSSWLSTKHLISSTFGNFTLLDSSSMTTTLYDFDKNVLYQCDSCIYYTRYFSELKGVYNIQLSNRKDALVNFRGKDLRPLIDRWETTVYDLNDQVNEYNNDNYVTLEAREEEFIKLFNESKMSKRITK